MAVLAPIPSANEKMATHAKPGLLAKIRSAYRKSDIRASAVRDRVLPFDDIEGRSVDLLRCLFCAQVALDFRPSCGSAFQHVRVMQPPIEQRRDIDATRSRPSHRQ